MAAGWNWEEIEAPRCKALIPADLVGPGVPVDACDQPKGHGSLHSALVYQWSRKGKKFLTRVRWQRATVTGEN